jgi:transglutaminase-like putative cysteine protease
VRYEISHRTTYVYDDVVSASYGQLHQMPSDIHGQRCLVHDVVIEPTADTYGERTDFFGNRAAMFAIHVEHRSLVVATHCVVDTSGRPSSFAATAERPWEALRDSVWEADGTVVDGRVVEGRVSDRSVRGFALESPMVADLGAVRDYAAPSFAPGCSLRAAVTDLTHRIKTEFTYEPGTTEVDTTLDEVMRDRRGVCQDFAHLLLGGLRSVGLPAAYVSGYIETVPPPGKQRLQGADQTHAWVAVYCGDGQWIGVDPTNDQIAGPRYVTTACGRDYSDVPPLKGVIYTNAKKNELTVEVDVIGS